MPLTFRLDDPEHRFAAVRLCSDLHLPTRDFERQDGEWVLELPQDLNIQRVEYELEVEHPDGGKEWIADPGHETRAPGAFGEKSVLQDPGYEEPWWLDAPKVEASITDVPLGVAMRRRVVAGVWAPADVRPEDPLPVLLAHDGPEYDKLARVTDWAAASVEAGHLPPFRLALLPPGDRDQWYSASEGYARALAEKLGPALASKVAVTGPVAGMGASLGALAMLHAHRRFPGVLEGLFLQSGSFFMPEHDAHEGGFARFQRIIPFVRGIHRTRQWNRPVPVAITCGAEEENVHNNRDMAASLQRQGYDVEYAENPDMHNYTGWRDTFDPYLTNLLQRLWG